MQAMVYSTASDTPSNYFPRVVKFVFFGYCFAASLLSFSLFLVELGLPPSPNPWTYMNNWILVIVQIIQVLGFLILTLAFDWIPSS
jgi:hypothetical protein